MAHGTTVLLCLLFLWAPSVSNEPEATGPVCHLSPGSTVCPVRNLWMTSEIPSYLGKNKKTPAAAAGGGKLPQLAAPYLILLF